MSRVLYPFNFVPNGQIFDGMNINYSPCFRKRTTQAVGTRTTRPIGLTLTDAMRLAWIVRSFKMDFINIPQQEIYVYSNNDPGYPEGPFGPPQNEEQLVCCGLTSPSINPPTWASTFFGVSGGNYFVQVFIQETSSWIADGYPTPQSPNHNFNPINDLIIYPSIIIQIQSQRTASTNYLAYTSGISSSPKVSGIFLPKSAGFSKDYELDYYKGTLSSSFNAAPSFTFDNFWEYRDENGENPIWNKITGARI
jgi:hypothetical protein